jgi:hypothetical protein
MTLKSMGRAALAFGMVVALTGCAPKMTREVLRTMKPVRPAELDQLNCFAGKWQFEGTVKMAGMDEKLKVWGTNEGRWDGNNWYLVSHGDFGMEEMGVKKGGEAWTYDSKAKVYRSVYVEEGGTSGYGTATYDAGTRTWHMHSKSFGGMGDGEFKGEAKVLDANTIQWTGAAYAGLSKVMEFDGTSRRATTPTNASPAQPGSMTPPVSNAPAGH